MPTRGTVQPPLPQDELSRLESLRDVRVLDTAPEQIFDDFARLALLICDTPIAVVGFIDERRVWFKAKIGLDLDQIPREESLCTHAILQAKILIVPDPSSDEKFSGNRWVTQAGIKFYAGIPLIVNGYALGALAVMDRIPHLLTAEQKDSLRILARRITSELESGSRKKSQGPQRELHLAPGLQPYPTILLVEDDVVLRKLLHRTLEKAGFPVLAATDSAAALQLVQQHSGAIQLVVSDLAMPRLNGLELSQRISASLPEIKFLFITRFADRFPELDRLIKNGANILEKPFLPSELMQRVEQMLNRPRGATGTEG
jgi:CheY-like chemotaxis protein